tara:strand:+ start:16156 stop:20577 length:4422 start_codon:yes stop_codon:yes gene_type:complete
MARTVPGSGAVIKPIFDEIFGVKAVEIENPGSLYDPADPPRLTITGCGTPEQEALLYPIIDEDSGKIIHVRVLERGKGYDPLRLQVTPSSETPNVLNSFDINRIWQTHPNSPTSGTFQSNTDRLRIQSDNHIKPTWTEAEAAPGGGPLIDRSFDQTFIYRGGKDVPNPGTREIQSSKVVGILANGGLLHTPDWSGAGNPHPGFNIDTVKHKYIKNTNSNDVLVDGNISYYHSLKSILEFDQDNGVFDWGRLEQFTWNVKVEYDNIMLTVSQVDETLGNVEVGRIVDEVSGAAKGTISKVVRNNQNLVTHVYLRLLGTTEDFVINDTCLGSNGFSFIISDNPTPFPEGIFYIDFGPEANEFGPFVPGQYYMAPENIKVKRNYLIIWNQSDSSNQQGAQGHPMRFSTTPDGPLNPSPGTLYYKSTGVTEAPAADYENQWQPLFIMNADESQRIYYHCAHHQYMSGWTGHAGYISLDTDIDNPPTTNTYYFGTSDADGYQDSSGNAIAVDYARHTNGHSKILGMSYDGYPIYGPYGKSEFTRFSNGSYTRILGGVIEPEVSGYRLRTTAELPGNRPDVVTPSTVTYAVTLSNNKFLFDGSTPSFLELFRGKTYVFNQDDSSNDGEALLISTSDDGWHGGTLGDTAFVYSGHGKVKYYLEETEVTYASYIAGFDAATKRELRFEVPVDAPAALYTFSDTTAAVGVRTVQDGYVLGDLIEDYIFDESPAWDKDTDYDQYDTVVTPSDNGENNSYSIYEATAAITASGDAQDEPGHTSGTTANWKFVQYRGTLDRHNGRFAVTPEYPNGTYAYFMTGKKQYTGDNLGEYGTNIGAPEYPYTIGPRFYGTPLFEGDTPPDLATEFPTTAEGEVVLGTGDQAGKVAYIRMTKKGDNFFGGATARILGGQGTGAEGTPTVQTVTGLSLLNGGRSYATPPTLIFEGGGGQGAQGAASIDTRGKVTSVSIVDGGEFYQEAPSVLITGGGGLGAKAEAIISQGQVTAINVTEQGQGYTSAPNIIFTKLVDLKRKTRARQAYNSGQINLTGLVKDVGPSDLTIYVDDTSAYPGSGQVIVNKETITYTNKSDGRFYGLTRGVNFNYDQRVILDSNQSFNFSVGDRVIRQVENANNKVAKVYDWDPEARELLVVFEIDELAFIDGGIPSTEDAIVQFDAGTPQSAPSGFDPHIIIDAEGTNIVTLTTPLGTIVDKDFQDIAENDGAGDGIPDLVNTGTTFENQISLEGGIYSSLYGIEETQGGTNTTLFQVGDSIKDASIPFKFATITEAGGLSEGVSHNSIIDIYVDANNANGLNFSVNEIVTGDISGVRGTVVSWDPVNLILRVQDIAPYNTGNINVGINGWLYEFSHNSSIVDFYIQNPGTNYTAPPVISIENSGDIQATGTVNMTTAGDQVASVTISNGGYGIQQSVDNLYALHPTVTFTNASGDSTGSGAVAYAIMGGENIVGNGGASYRIKRIEYNTIVRSK